MAPNSLSPASVVIDYHTDFAPHRMTIPTKEWFPTSITGVLGSYEAWDLSPVDAEVMVNNLCVLLADLVPASTIFDTATVYTQATPTSENIPRASASLAIVGTGAAGSFPEAVSGTFNFKTLANGDAKLVLLDFPLGTGGFRAIHPSAFGAEVLALEAEFISPTRAWSGRDDSRPAALRKVTFDLNDKLQKEYRMSA